MPDFDEIQQSLATAPQRKYFFALCNELGLDVEKAKERVKQKYGLESFADAQRKQLKAVVDTLKEQVDKKMQAELVKVYQNCLNEGFKIEEIARHLVNTYDIRRKKE